MSRRRTSLRTNWKNGQPVESLENRVVPAAVAVSFSGTTLTLTSTPGVTNEVVAVKAGAAFTDILVGGKLTTRLDGTGGTDIATIVFNADAGTGDSLSVTGVTTDALTVTLTGVEKLQLNTGDALSDVVTVNSTGAASLTLVTSNVNGDLSLTHNGAITQSGKLIVSDATSITATGSDITLKTSGNSFGTLTLIGADITVNEAGPTHLGATTSASGNLKVTSTGTITTAGTINVDVDTTLNSNGAAITVTGAFGGSVSLKGTTVAVTDTDGNTDLGKSTANSTLTVTSNGAITNSGSLTVGGLATFTADSDGNGGNGFDRDITLTTGSNNFGSLSLLGAIVEVREKSATDLFTTTATGDLTITSAGAITDSGVITVAGDTTLSAKGKTITLDTTTSTFGDSLVMTGTDISVIDSDGATTLGAVTAKGNLTITSTGAGAGAGVDQTDVLTVSGRITVDANDGTNVNDITLTNASNRFGSIAVDGADIQVTEADASDLFTSTATGLLTLLSGGAVTDSGVLTVGGVTTLQAGPSSAGATSKSITLDDLSNAFSDTINLTGANATLINTDTSALGNISLTSGMTLTSTGAVTQTTNTSISVGGRLTIDAADDITVDGTGTGTDNFGSISLTTTGNAIVREDSSSDLFNSTIDGTFELDSTGAVTDSGDVDVGGTTNIDAATTVTLNSTGSDYVGEVSLDGTSISFLNNTDTTLATVTTSGAGTLTIISDGNITDADTGADNDITTGTGLITFNAGGNISITDTDNLLDGAVSLFGDTVTLTTGATTAALTLATSDIRAGLTLTVAGALTQSGTVTVADVATINTGANNITLNSNPNEFGSLLLTGGAVDINESGDTDLGTSSVSSLKITSSGNIADSGTLTVAGLAEMIAGSGSLVFDSAASNFGSLKLSIRDDITVTEAAGSGGTAGTALAGVTTQESFTLTSAGAVTQSAAINVSGDVTLVADSNGSTAGGEQDITLNGSSNIFGDTATDGITFTGANVRIHEINSTVLSPNLAAPSIATGTLNIRSAGSITAGGVVTVGSNMLLIAGDTNINGDSDTPEVISLANAGNSFDDNVRVYGGLATIHDNTGGTVLGTTSVSSLTLTSPGGNVTQTSSLSVTDLLSITANTTDGDVTLNTSTNSLNRLSITGNDVNINDTGNANGAVIDFLNATGNFTLNTTGNVSASSKDITIGGNTTITASGSVNLDPVFGNDVNVTAGGDVTLHAVGNLVLGDITTSGNLMVTATGNVTNDTTDNGFGTLDVNGNVTITVDAGSTVTINILNSDSNITGSLTGATTTVTPAASTITVDHVTANNIVNIADGAGPFTLTGTISGGNVGLSYDVTLLINGTTYATTVPRTGAGSDAFSISGVTLANLVGDADTTIAATVSNAADFGSFTPADGTATKTYVADIVAPAAPSITGVVDGSSSAVTDGSTVTTAQNNFTFTVGLNGTGATAPVVGDTLTLLNGSTVVGTRVLTSADITADSFSFSITLSAGASQVFTAVVTDVAGNPSAASATFTLTVT